MKNVSSAFAPLNSLIRGKKIRKQMSKVSKDEKTKS